MAWICNESGPDRQSPHAVCERWEMSCSRHLIEVYISLILKALFFVFLQSKPLIPLQKEEDTETHKTVLTNYMFPQQTRTEDCEYLVMQNLQLSHLPVTTASLV